jgi:hypothetical protein
MKMRESSVGGRRSESSSREKSANASAPAIKPGTRCDAQIKSNPNGSWDLLVNGRVAVSEESYSVCEAVWCELMSSLPRPYSEASEIADSIRNSLVSR